RSDGVEGPPGPLCFSYSTPTSRSQRLQEGLQVGDLGRREADVEAAVVERDHLVDRISPTVVGVWRARREGPQGRSLHLGEVGALAGDHRAPEVGHLLAGA